MSDWSWGYTVGFTTGVMVFTFIQWMFAALDDDDDGPDGTV